MSGLSTLNVKLVDGEGKGIAYGPAEPSIHVAFGTGTYDEAAFRHYCDGVGAVSIENMAEGAYRIHPRAKGYVATPVDKILPVNDQFEIPMVWMGGGAGGLEIKKLSGIDGERHRFIDAEGKRVFLRGADAFLLYKKFLDGKTGEVREFLAQHRALGFNMLRVFGMFESLGGFDPRAYGDSYYNRILEFCKLCEEYGMYVFWVCCAATGAFFNESQAIDHIKRSVGQLKGAVNTIGSPVNEQGIHNNSVNLWRVKGEVDWGGMLHDMGSYGSDTPCSDPLGDFCCLHTIRQYPGQIKDCAPYTNPNFENGKELGIDEGYRAGDDGSGTDHQNPRVAAEAAAMSYACVLYVFHSLQGERGDVLFGNTLDCARASVEQLRRIE